MATIKNQTDLLAEIGPNGVRAITGARLQDLIVSAVPPGATFDGPGDLAGSELHDSFSGNVALGDPLLLATAGGDPAGIEGLVYFQTAGPVVRVFDGATWRSLAFLSSDDTPKILAQIFLGSQSADISDPSVILVTPISGFYRLSVIWFTQTTDAGAGTILATAHWTDIGDNPHTSGYDPEPGPSPVPIGLPVLQQQQLTQLMECQGGTPIACAFTGGGTYGTATWGAYLVLEQLMQNS